MKLLVASGNSHKLKEFREMLDELNVEWLSLHDVGLGNMDVTETGSTFAENAILKAEAYRSASGLLTLADDSGLVVDALNGAPGVISARYGAPDLVTDQDRYRKVLTQLDGIPDERRTARFVCVIAIAPPNAEIVTVEGIIEGHIGYEPRGTNGFGYDPIFYIADGRALAELPSEQKNRISHRGRALQAALPILKSVIKKTNV